MDTEHLEGDQEGVKMGKGRRVVGRGRGESKKWMNSLSCKEGTHVGRRYFSERRKGWLLNNYTST